MELLEPPKPSSSGSATVEDLVTHRSPGLHRSEKALLALLRAVPVHGLAHITGGGLTDNIPRVLPAGLEAVLERRRWGVDPVFEWLQSAARVADDRPVDGDRRRRRRAVVDGYQDAVGGGEVARGVAGLGGQRVLALGGVARVPRHRDQDHLATEARRARHGAAVSRRVSDR